MSLSISFRAVRLVAQQTNSSSHNSLRRNLSRRALGLEHIHIPRRYPSCQFCKPFSTTISLSKKAGKKNTSKARSDSSPPVNKSDATQTPVDDAFDVSELEARILNAMEKLTHKLSLLRQGGKLNPEELLKLNVTIGTGPNKEKVKLRDIAQIIPRGRYINVVVGEEEYIKSVTTAIQASKHNLNPEEPKPDNPLTLPVPIPPPTRAARRETIEEAKKIARDAEATIQSARQGHNKRLRQLSIAEEIRPDDLKNATKLMEETVKSGKEEVKRIVDGAMKVLDQH